VYKFNSPEVHSSRGGRGTELKDLCTSCERFTTAESFQSSNGRRYTHVIPLHFIVQLDLIMNSEVNVLDDDDLGVS